MQHNSKTLKLIIAYLSFASLGLYDGMLGVAWPSIRHTYNVSLDALGLILAAGTVGFFVIGANSGQIAARIGTGLLLLFSHVLRVAGLIGFALLPSWWGIVGAGLLIGLGTGGLDAGFNTYVAMRYPPSRMNWLHASYGIGTTLAPPLLLAAIQVGHTWQWGYAAVAVVQGALLLYFMLAYRQWQAQPEPDKANLGPSARVRSLDTIRFPAVWLGIAVFFVFTGLESAAGQWTYTLFTEQRHIAASTAAFWVSLYWGSFTVGRILLGFVADHVETTWLLRAGMVGSVVGALLLWWNPAAEASFAGLALLGISIAPLYPGLIAITPSRVGADHTANAIGFQVAAASLGFSLLPGLAGVLAASVGLAIIPPFLFAAALLVLGLFQASAIAARLRRAATS